MADKLKPSGNKLTSKEQRFCHEYVKNGGNKSRASIAAGYTNLYAGQALCKRADIAHRIEQLQEELEDKLEITSERVLREFCALAFSNIDDFFEVTNEGDVRMDFNRSSRFQRASIAELSQDVYWEGRGEQAERVRRTKVKFHDKAKALEALAKRLNLFGDRDTSSEDEETTKAGKLRKALKLMLEADGLSEEKGEAQ